MTFLETVTALIGFFNDTVIPLLFALMFMVFIWGVFNYFFVKAEDPAARAEGMQFMIWGVVGLAVVVSMWGLVGLLLGSVGI